MISYQIDEFFDLPSHQEVLGGNGIFIMNKFAFSVVFLADIRLVQSIKVI